MRINHDIFLDVNVKQGLLSLILPARNEGEGLRRLLPELVAMLPEAEIIVVNDGSDDDTLAVCAEFPVRVVSHPYPKGNGAAIKSGARAANGEVLVFMDADGQHKPEDILALLKKIRRWLRHGSGGAPIRFTCGCTPGSGE